MLTSSWGTVESRYNVPRLQRIHRYNVLFPRSRFHVMENSRSGYNVLSLQRIFFRHARESYNATRLYKDCSCFWAYYAHVHKDMSSFEAVGKLSKIIALFKTLN